jgi:hypothetical protein
MDAPSVRFSIFLCDDEQVVLGLPAFQMEEIEGELTPCVRMDVDSARTLGLLMIEAASNFEPLLGFKLVPDEDGESDKDEDGD